jgi:hypothetical protein
MGKGDGSGLDDFWVVVTCMGRLAFVKQTLPTVIADAAVRYCLVDFSCPDHAGDWLEAAHGERIQAGAMTVARVQGQQFFHKTAALNAGARAALARGARTLCFADADTAFVAGAFADIGARLTPGAFLVSERGPDGASIPSLTGLLVLAARDFERAGGYDEAFADWGSEDVEMRLRLHLRWGLAPRAIPVGLVRPLAHGDWLRTRFHRERDLRKSAARNEAMLRARLVDWTGQPLENLSQTARSLLFARL